LEVGSRPEEAIAYCEKAASVCKARLQRLTNEVKSFSDSASSASKLERDEQKFPGSESNTSIVDKQAEIETLTGLASELEKKVDFININQLRLPIVLMLF
jgi:nuclear autoantigenic sperm protein